MFKGQRIRESIGPSRKGAEKVIAKKKAEIAENKYLDVRKEPDPIKFHDFAKQYLQWSKANKKPSAFQREISFMRILNRKFETMPIQDITPWLIEKWKGRRKKGAMRSGGVMGFFKTVNETERKRRNVEL